MCGVDQGLNKTKRIEELLAIEPLPNGEPFEIVEGGAKVWHPVWMDKIDSTINSQFIQGVVDCIWKNELVRAADINTTVNLLTRYRTFAQILRLPKARSQMKTLSGLSSRSA